MKLELEDTVSISLETHMEKLALEANVLANLIDTFRNILPVLTNKISGALVPMKLNNSSEVIEAIKTFRTLEPKLKHVNYMNYVTTVVAVPENFSGELLSYINTLIKLSPEIYTQTKLMLNEYKSLLAVFISNKDSRNSLKDDRSFFAKIEKNRADTSALLESYFPGHTDKSVVYLKDVLGRFADLHPLTVALSKLDSKHNSQNLVEIESLTKECVDLLNIVMENIKVGSIDNVNGVMSMNLSTGAYEVAKYLEFLSVFKYRVMQGISSVNKLITQLDVTIR
jgi:hypothetical protein